MEDNFAKQISKEVEEDFQILQAANVAKPSEDDKKQFRRLMKEKPHYFDTMLSLMNNNLDFILSRNCSFIMAEKMKYDLRKMRDGLGYEDADEMEKLLIEQVCLNWLRTNLLEQAHASKTLESHTSATGLYWDKRLTAAHNRYLRACETLAKVRKLLAEAKLREQQAQNKRIKAAASVNKFLKNE